MELIWIAIGYVVIGLAFDLWVHMTNPIIYWDRDHALRSHAYLIGLWPVAVVASIINRFRK